MRHMDEGLLQAWLDGPRAGLSEAERTAIADHLAGCDACAARLEELRSTSDRALELLSVAEEGDEEIPAFEAVVRRAREMEAEAAAPSTPRPLWGRRTAWAASIVLALGAGWLANEWNTGTPEALLAPLRVTEAPAAAEADGGDERLQGAASRGSGEAVAAAPPELASAAADAGALDRPEAAAGASTDDAVVAELRPNAILSSASAVAGDSGGLRPPPAEPDPVARITGATPAPRSMDAVAAPAAAEAEEAFADGGGVPLRLGDPRWSPASLAEAEAGIPFAVGTIPGLPLTSVHVGSFGGVPAVRVVQELEDGRVLTSIQSAEPLVIEPDGSGTGTALTREDGVYLSLWADLPLDSLQSLLGRVESR